MLEPALPIVIRQIYILRKLLTQHGELVWREVETTLFEWVQSCLYPAPGPRKDSCERSRNDEDGNRCVQIPNCRPSDRCNAEKRRQEGDWQK